MKITAKNTFRGTLVLASLGGQRSSNPIEKTPFRIILKPGESIDNIDNSFYTLKSIQDALELNWIEITDMEDLPAKSYEIITPEITTPVYELTENSIINKPYYPQDAFSKYNNNFQLIENIITGFSIPYHAVYVQKNTINW